jgi:hypothetical protein
MWFRNLIGGRKDEEKAPNVAAEKKIPLIKGEGYC